MFTGIIEGQGNIAAIRSSGQGDRVTIEADFSLDQTKVGDSISVSGACLTAVKIENRRFEVDVSPETLKTTIFDQAKVGDRVNLERALRFRIVSTDTWSPGILTERASSNSGKCWEMPSSLR